MMLLARTQTGRSVRPAVAFRPATAAVRPVVFARAKAAEADVVSKKEDKKKHEEEEEFDDGPTPSTAQVEALLTALCNETEIAEMNLKMGSFSLKVKRSMSGHTAAVHAAPAAVHVAAAPAPVAAAPAPAAPESTPEDTVDESLILVNSPKVGVFRRGKYQGGKRVGKGNCVNEGDKVKKGQALGYVEQLGTHFPVEAPIPGEVTKFHIADGSPVEYQQLVVELSPYFGGHIIGDKKYA